MATSFTLSDSRNAVEKTAASAGITLTEDQLTAICNRIETYLYVYPAKTDLVAAFKEAATAESIAGDIEKMSKEFPTQLTSTRNARLQAEQNEAKKAKAQADAEKAKKEVHTKVGDIANTVNAHLEAVNGILSDARSKLPTIKSAAAANGVDGVTDVLDTNLQTIEDAAAGLIKCQTDVTKTSALRTAQTAEKNALDHLRAANTAKIVIDGIEARVNGAAEAAKATKAKKKEDEKESAKKAKKKVGKFDRFRSSPLGHAVIVMTFVAIMAILFFLYLPFWFQVGAIVVFVAVLGYHFAMWFTGHERRGQNVSAIVTVLVAVILAINMLMPLAGTGRGSDGSLIPDRSIETPTPTPGVDCWLSENFGNPECPLGGSTPES